MLRYREKEDFEARYRDVEAACENWRAAERKAWPELREEFREKLLISLIYHDAALEGEVLTHSEIKAAIDSNIISDTSLIPSYEEISNFYKACMHADQLAKQRRKPVKVDTVREVYALLAPEAVAGGLAYRKENPLHRLYYHDICAPEKINYKMRKLGEWMEAASTRELHPIERAAKTHWRLMAIFPWAMHTGRTARIIANLLLEQAGYPIAVIHSIDRQRYYESLRGDHMGLLSLYLEAVQTTAESEIRVYDEADRAPRRRRRA